jgi:hypothetical protein
MPAICCECLRQELSVVGMSWVSDRFQLLGKLWRQPFVRLLIIFWTASGIWDLALSE